MVGDGRLQGQEGHGHGFAVEEAVTYWDAELSVAYRAQYRWSRVDHCSSTLSEALGRLSDATDEIPYDR